MLKNLLLDAEGSTSRPGGILVDSADDTGGLVYVDDCGFGNARSGLEVAGLDKVLVRAEQVTGGLERGADVIGGGSGYQDGGAQSSQTQGLFMIAGGLFEISSFLTVRNWGKAVLLGTDSEGIQGMVLNQSGYVTVDTGRFITAAQPYPEFFVRQPNVVAQSTFRGNLTFANMQTQGGVFSAGAQQAQVLALQNSYFTAGSPLDSEEPLIPACVYGQVFGCSSSPLTVDAGFVEQTSAGVPQMGLQNSGACLPLPGAKGYADTTNGATPPNTFADTMLSDLRNAPYAAPICPASCGQTQVRIHNVFTTGGAAPPSHFMRSGLRVQRSNWSFRRPSRRFAMDDRSQLNLRSPRRRALALSVVLSFSLTAAAAATWLDVARADAGLPGTGPHAVIASGTEHTCALFYDGTIRCWGSNSLEQIGAAANLGFPGSTTEDQPLPVAPAYGSCVDNTDCVSGQCNAGACSCAWSCPSGETCNTATGVCQQCSTSCDCPGGCDAGVCTNHVCYTQPDGGLPGYCSTDSDCGTGRCNLEGYNGDAGLGGCVGCLQNSDCGSGGYCVGLQCLCGVAAVPCAAGTACTSTTGGTPGTCQAEACTTPPFGYTSPGDGGPCVPAAGASIPQVPQAPDGGPDGGALLIGNVVALATGDAHTCALVGGGTVWCWGENSAGQLGTGNFNTSSLPVQVVGIGGTNGDGGANTPAIAIAAGAYHTCAVLADGTARCWGDDNQAQLGASGAGARSNTPVAVSGLTGATAIAAGSEHTCALCAGGNVECWGGNVNGQAGVGSGATVASPTTVSGLSNTTAIVAGRLHTCALVVNGTPATTVKCWGYNGNGQLGNGSTTDSASPVSTGLSNVRSLSANGDHICALMANGTVQCWGDNGDGETGNLDAGIGNASTNSPNTASLMTPSPAPVTGLAGARSITSGYFHNCAVLDDGTVTCWGGDLHGQLGDNTLAVTGSGPPSTSADFGSVAPTLVTNGPQIVGGYYHNCALGADGRANCWGGTNGYDLGTGADTSTLVPVVASVLPICTGSGSAEVCRGATALCAGANFTCSLLSDGTVWCWGDDSSGQMGTDAGVSSTPVASPSAPVELGNTAVQITCNTYAACALLSDGTVQCWGDDVWGELGNGSSGGTSATPQTVQVSEGVPLDEVTFIASGSTGSHVCALQGGTSIYCWGFAAYGQAGPNATAQAQSYAVSVSLSGGKVAKSLGLGGLHSCALASDGTVQCWGYDGSGALGDDNPDAGAGANPIVSSPVPTASFTLATAVAGGYVTSCALGADSSLWCWGSNFDDAVGDGDSDTTSFWSPVNVVTSTSANLTGGACVSAGFYDACALATNGLAYCWGFGGWGQLGDGSTSNAAYAAPVSSSGSPIDE
jgi:alpha-tubulin suppressor-like RCC1 family protein